MKNWDSHRMDYYSNNGQRPHRHHNQHHRSRNQSFSSALLAAICKSTEDEGGMLAYNKNGSRVEMRNVLEAENNRLTRNSRVQMQWNEDPWKDKEKFMRRRSSKMGVFNSEKNEGHAASSKHREFRPSFLSNMSSATFCSSDYTSDSTSSCPYLSSDAESLYRHTYYNPTERNSHHVRREDRGCKWAIRGECSRDLHGKSLVRDGDFLSTEKPFIPADRHAKKKSKSKSRKDSKKPRQSSSPGRKLVNFLNLLFMAAGTKKRKLSSSSSVCESNSYDSSERKQAFVYSSSSSVQSRPCLSKTSRGSKNSSGMSHKSVTFYPPSLVVDEDSCPSGKKCLQGKKKYPQITHPVPNSNPANYPHIAHSSADAYKLPLVRKELKQHILVEDEHVAAAAKEIIPKHKKVNTMMESVVITSLHRTGEEEEGDDDDASCSSSDLFELENLAAIHMNMNVYQTELPVYETTHFMTNEAISKRLIL